MALKHLFARSVRPVFLATALTLTCFAAASSQAQAQVTVTGSRTGVVGAFTYSFDIFNGTAQTLAFVSLDIPANTLLTNFVSPTGFFTDYAANPAQDGSVPGNIVFAEDFDDTTLQTFAPFTTVGTFRFDSPTLFTPSSFTALDVNGVIYQSNVINFPGTTVLTNGAAAAAPEPGTLGLLALSGVPAATLFVRRRRSVRNAA